MAASDQTTPADIVAYWRDAGAERWFTKDEAFDQAIRARFLPLWNEAATGGLRHWRDSDEGLLALIILLDQFPRNMFRGNARAYATDPMALEVARHAIDRGADIRVETDLRQFIYMPFMHSEQLADQERCIALFRASGQIDNLRYAETHADIVRRFGRFPHRNILLGRTTTEQEQRFLEAGGFAG